MNRKIVAFVLIFTVVGSVAVYYVYTSPSNVTSELSCPQDESRYVWTQIDASDENYNWSCFERGHTWIETYSKAVYEQWLNAVLQPAFVRDYTLLYLRTELKMDFPDPLMLNWTGGRETPDSILGYETYIYRVSGLIVTIGYPIILPENETYKIIVQMGDRILWDGTLYHRAFTTYSPLQNIVYDSSGGVGLFEQGIHVIATSYDPMIKQATSDGIDTLISQNELWLQLNEYVTLQASNEDFISIIMARGDYPTGGYGIHVTSFSWLESYPVKFRFNVDFTNPGDGVAVTQALTNPLVLIPIDTLTMGDYVVEVHINTYILTFDDQGNPIYTVLRTFKAEMWTLTFTVK